MDRFAFAVLSRVCSDFAGFWASNWRSVLVFSVITGFASAFLRLQLEGDDQWTVVREASWLAFQGTAISASLITVLVLVSYLVLAPSRVWLKDRQSVSDLQARVDEFVKRQTPHIEIFVDNPSDPPFRFNDPLTPDQEIITVGVRTLSPTPVHNIEIRVDKYAPTGASTPPVLINTIEPLEIVRGALMFGHARPGQPVYGMVLTVRRFSGAALPEVRVCYMNSPLNSRHEPFPRGEWYLKIVAASEESPAARAYFHLMVKDDPLDRVRLTNLSPDEIERIVAGGGAEAAVFVEERHDGSTKGG